MSKKQEIERTTAIGLRVSPQLATWLKEQAKTNQRSLSNQVAWVIAQYRSQQQETQGATV
jgi:hypothetical protein